MTIFAIGNHAQPKFTLDFPASLRRLCTNMNAAMSIRPEQKKERFAAARAEYDRKTGLSAVQRWNRSVAEYAKNIRNN